jgi:hypothetical protein
MEDNRSKNESVWKLHGLAIQDNVCLLQVDGTYYGSGYFGTGSGTWSIKGNTVNTYVGGKLYASYEIISVTSTTSELKMSMDGDAIWIKCKKE